jgi:hypothetical protein
MRAGTSAIPDVGQQPSKMTSLTEFAIPNNHRQISQEAQSTLPERFLT